MSDVLEEAVRATYDNLRASHAEFCSCPQCQDDVMALAMSHARSRYVSTTALGAAVTRVTLSQDAAKAELAVIVFGAMRKVADAATHAPESAT